MVDTKRIEVTDDSYLNPDIRDDAPMEKPKEEEKSDRPEWLPEKFATAEELAKSYAELEKKNSQPIDEQKDENKSEQQIKIEKETGLELNPFFDEYAEKGELAEESYNKLNKLGLPKDLVESYIEGQKALSTNQSQEIFGEVGGQDNYGRVIEWAKNNLEEAEVNAFNNVIDKGNNEEMKLAVQGLHARYSKSEGSEPNLVTGDANVTQNVFRSTAEIVKAMQDPRYKVDKAYRNDVEQKLARSDIT
jgi:hypothetical protein|tara:strand:- start:98 stop:838 length:741 start_codon:yes stop_codon:yes gene_type:complete